MAKKRKAADKRTSSTARTRAGKKTATSANKTSHGSPKKRASKRSSSPKRSSGTRSAKARSAPASGPQRLNKVLASAGLGSRREVEELIVQGRVEVENEIVSDLSTKVDPSSTTIKVDGQRIKQLRPVYFILNKPKGVLSTNKDPSGRMRVIDFVPDNQRVFCVGRLDKSSEGLMLLTNDGELAQKLAHPSFRVQKVYHVVVAGLMSKEELAKLRKGVYLSEGFARIDGAKIKKQRKSSTELEITLSEGKNREIRRILARAGHKVVTLRRLAIGPLRLAQLPVGAARLLTPTEVTQLYAIESESQPKKKAAPKRGKRAAKTAQDPVLNTPPAPSSKPELDNDFDDDIVQLPFVFDDSDEFDDDFVTFGSESTGSVLAYDESPDSGSEPSKGRRPRSSSATRPPKKPGRGSGSSRTTAGQRKGKKKASPRSKSRDGSTKGNAKTASKPASSKRPGSRKRAAGSPASSKRPSKRISQKRSNPKKRKGN